jgi:hypothetical protein
MRVSLMGFTIVRCTFIYFCRCDCDKKNNQISNAVPRANRVTPPIAFRGRYSYPIKSIFEQRC